MTKITILINCLDQQGIIANITNYIARIKGNIIYLDQHVDRDLNVFFMRLEFELNDSSFVTIDNFKPDFEQTIALKYGMNWELYTENKKSRMAIFVSKYDHCLYDILARYSAGEFHLTIPLIISNHRDLKTVADQFKIPFAYIPFTKETKEIGEKQQIQTLTENNIDFIVLARYMQIITKNIINLYPNKIINIHHSFLPAFPGAKPYHSAFNRGVKIIGTTSHYVTEELDEGPIIEQDIARVTHVHSIQDFIMKGRDLERIVLSRAIKLHAERKTLVYANKTVIFI